MTWYTQNQMYLKNEQNVEYCFVIITMTICIASIIYVYSYKKCTENYVQMSPNKNL